MTSILLMLANIIKLKIAVAVEMTLLSQFANYLTPSLFVLQIQFYPALVTVTSIYQRSRWFAGN